MTEKDGKKAARRRIEAMLGASLQSPRPTHTCTGKT